MKNWDTLEPDIRKLMNKHYTPGRQGHRVEFIVVHHNAGRLTTESIWQVWQKRKASAHFQVEASGRIGQLVALEDTAWHAGNWSANIRSIGIETANIDNSGDWRVSTAALDNLAHLIAAVCHYYDLGTPTWGVNVFPHQHFSATDCPGELAKSQRAELMSKARAYYTNTQPTTPAPASVDVEALARDVIAGKYGNGQARKDALGANYAVVQARVNEILKGTNPTPASVDVEALARDVIAGKYGNGQARKDALGANYAVVQARVNEILKG